MQLTKERKILVGVLALGMGALVVDRLFLATGASGPSQASAAETSTSASTGSAADSAGTGSVSSLTTKDGATAQGPSVAEQLRHAAARETAAKPRNAFSLASPWFAKSRSQQTRDSWKQRVTTFRRNHQLDAVLGGSNGSATAVINGESLSVGDSVGGFNLVAIGSRSAVFSNEAGRFTLYVSEPGGSR